MRNAVRSRWLGVAVAFGATVGLAACSTPGGDAPATTSAAPTASALPTGPVELVVDDIEGASRDAAMVAINAAFQAKYPNVTIKRIKSAFGDQQTKQPLTMAGPNPPDVVEIAVGNAAFAKMGNQGLIANLDAFATQYKWPDRFAKSLLDQARFDSSGQILKGPLYGIYQVEDVVGVYYNKKKLADLGLSVPKTFDDFQAALDKAKSAGETPMMLGNLDSWPAAHVHSILLNRSVNADDINGWTFHTKDVSWNTQPFIDVATAFQKWGVGGYFEKDFNALGYDDATKRFTGGEGLFLPAGTWITQSVKDQMGANAGFFLVGPDAGRPAQVLGGQGQFWGIGGKSKNQQFAAAYLDFITSDEAGKILVDNGSVPGFHMSQAPSIPDGVFKDVYDAIQLANSTYAITAFEDTATPSMLNTRGAGFQKLLVGKMTPQELTKSFQDDYDKAKAK